MAVNTTLLRNSFNRGLYGTVNIRVASTTGIAPGGALTVAGDLGLLAIHELPNSFYTCEVTSLPRGKNRLILRVGDTVTG